MVEVPKKWKSELGLTTDRFVTYSDKIQTKHLEKIKKIAAASSGISITGMLTHMDTASLARIAQSALSPFSTSAVERAKNAMKFQEFKELKKMRENVSESFRLYKNPTDSRLDKMYEEQVKIRKLLETEQEQRKNTDRENNKLRKLLKYDKALSFLNDIQNEIDEKEVKNMQESNSKTEYLMYG